ncbi:MAG: branched-chain amino acid ABC transporter permease [Candidatus Eremiobacteraeota bacterium]|nr:branched-chain amino acid ABC transporter permease [Candidatus Eremiobacteraeota bacterium]
MSRLLRHPLLWTAAVLLILPWLLPGANPFIGKAGFIDLGTTIVIFALFAMGFNLLFGHVGDLSFGHAMFFTIGAYATALFTKGFNVTVFGQNLVWGGANSLWATLALSVVLVSAWAFLLARLIVPRSSGIYFSMITLAFAQVVYFSTYKWDAFTGGEDGLQAITRPPLFAMRHSYLNESWHFYYFAAVIVFVALAIIWWIVESPFGSVCHAIRENEQRAAFLGYDVRKYRINAFFLSALFPAIAGCLWTYYQQSITPDAGSIEYSGRVVMMSLLGGIQTFFGPMLGSFIYWQLQNDVSQVTKYWEAWIGAVFVVFVLIAPRGIWGAVEEIEHYGLRDAVARLFSRRARVETDMAEEVVSQETAASEVP